jgi:hypothetical protein
MHVSLHANYPFLSPDFNRNWNVHTDFDLKTVQFHRVLENESAADA